MASVRAVLRDLVESGLVFRSGRGDQTVFRGASADDHAALEAHGDDVRVANMVWVVIHRFGPITREGIRERMPIDEPTLDRALDRLLADGQLREQADRSTVEYSSDRCVIPLGAEHGWEAAVLDHYQAVVSTICSKLRTGTSRPVAEDWIGGSTYGLDVWPGHPKFDEVTGFLRDTRRRAVELRSAVESHNAESRPMEGEPLHVVVYVGQNVLDPNEDERGESS